MARFEIVTACGRGPHLAASHTGDQTCCMRPVLARTGREGSAQTRGLCPTCAKAAAGAS